MFRSVFTSRAPLGLLSSCCSSANRGSNNAGQSSLKLVVLLCTAVTLLTSFWGLRMFLVSRDFLKKTLPEVAQVGSSLSIEGCVDRALVWFRSCQAMKSMCDSSVPRIMMACLQAKPRQNDCVNIEHKLHSTHFGYAECKARNLEKGFKKACAASYRAIDNFCTETAPGTSFNFREVSVPR